MPGQLGLPLYFISQDERLARFVTGSHMKHHPNATEQDMDEDLVSHSQTLLKCHFHFFISSFPQ